MHISHRFIALALLIALSVVAACAPDTAPVAPPATLAPAPAAGFPLQLTDDNGRAVTIAAAPQRIISLAPSITEILFAVDAGDQVVGITQYCNYPPEAAQGREIVGGFTPDTLSVEKILSLEPDVVFADGLLQKPVIEALQNAGVTVIAFNSVGFESVYANIVMVGQATAHAAVAQDLVAKMQARLAAIAAVVDKIPAQDRPNVFYEVWDEPLMTAGPTTFTGQMIEKAGGVNIFADVKEEYPQVSAEAVVARDPDIIIGPASHAEGLTTEKIAARPGWSAIKAVQDKRVVVIDADISSRPGPRIVDAVEMITKLLYPADSH